MRIQVIACARSISIDMAAGCFAEPPPAPLPCAVFYRNAQGQGWDGRGAMPDWLQRAIRAGQVEHFRGDT